MKRRKKIVYIISDIDKALAFEWIAEGLDPEAYEISFILLLQEPAHLTRFLQERGIPCRVIRLKGKRDFPRVGWKLLRLLWALRPAVVHCHLFNASILGLAAAKMAGIRTRIYTRHHSDYHHRYFPGGIKWDQWCNRLATKIVAPSKAVKEVLVNLERVPPQKVVIIHHGFDLDYFRNPDAEAVAQLRSKYGTAGHHPVIGVISRFTELKGIQYIIPAFQRLLGTYPGAKLLLFNARGDYEAPLMKLLEALPPPSYQTVPFEQNLSAVYPLMDVFIQASTDYAIEAFGQTYVEALAAGIPSVFTLSGIAGDFIEDGRQALVVPFRDSDAIYEALQRLLSDSELRQRLVAEGWNSVRERFALQKMIGQLEQLYEAG